MSNLVVKVKSRDGFPGGNEPETTVWISGEYDAAPSYGPAYGNMGYRNAVEHAKRLAKVLGADLDIAPMGKFLSQLQAEGRA